MFRFGDPGGAIYAALGASNANFLAHWTSLATGSSTLSIQATGGWDGGSCLRTAVLSVSNLIHFSKTLDSQATWGIAFRLKVSALPAVGSRVGIVALEDNGTIQVQLVLDQDGTLAIERGGSIAANGGTGTNLGTSSWSLSLNQWYHFELKVTINNTTGSIELRRSGTAIIGPTSSLNTRSSANNSANAVRFGFFNYPASTTFSSNLDWDDIIVWDAQATDANGFSDIHDFIGDCGLTWLLPSGAGTTTQFTPDSGSNYARVNEATPDGDTSYVESATIGQIDTYAVTDLAATVATVKSVATVHYARKTDVGSRGMKSEVRAGGGNTAHATEIALGNSYQYYFTNWGQNPNNGSPAAWTPTMVNSLEAGQTVSS